MKLLLVSGDLILSARVVGAARSCGLEMITVAEPSRASEVCDDSCKLVLVDLRCPGLDISSLVDSLRHERSSDLSIIACGPHVHEQRLEAARQAGCDVVVTRGQLERDAEAIFQRLLNADC